MPVEIRQLTTMSELYEMQKVEAAVWQMDPIPVHQTFTAMHHGGIILGAFEEDQMVGFLYSFAGFDGKVSYLCSHMMGMLPGYRMNGLGEALKFKQAEIARKLGYDMITWTYDPLESRNAYVNLHKLGAVGAIYHPNHYGEMADELNHGLPTDRFQIKWELGEKKSVQPATWDIELVLLDGGSHGEPIIKKHLETADIADSSTYFVAIPADFQTMKQTDFTLAKSWRLETGKVFKKLFDHGFQARDLLRTKEEAYSYYVFIKE
ncbi:GNAT family N-acetyltransferase [Virgibacillus halodenitrificans]|uniref:GNAT family N-acetyltransferase n=1 Tax=Virgibacillus halodenitrificans TaxID=1482 RepID=UPI000EF4CDCA|nr:GNAT family N-acetyltransferase [Virgibacillus halodenitrificans]